ncbi:hypothetical protein OCU04_011589 [Sclerotinia nivalis]|uniref:Uncharacterized protein n=1 Tax=Sclerotinia nivalis TaxID=352851 RepID=A0A9X0ABT8_9HELO|nr:hypothetical protein OCU04_011589 [Sclerotinia nivalis]
MQKQKYERQRLESANASLRDKDTTILSLREEKVKLMETCKMEATRPLLKQISAIAREIAEKEAEMKHLRDSHHNREQVFKNQIDELESNLVTTKEKLAKALEEHGKVRDEYFARIQRGHYKVSTLERELKAEEEAQTIMNLDCNQEIEAIKERELRKERDELRDSGVIQAQLNDSENAKVTKAAKKAVQTLKAKAPAAIQELSQLKKDYTKQIGESSQLNEHFTMLEKIKTATKSEN